MSQSAAIWRVLEFRRRYGLWATVERTSVVLKRCFWNRFVLFCADLDNNGGRADGLDRLTIECKIGEAEIGVGDFKRMVNLWQPESIRKLFAERFEKGAVLWLGRISGELACYGWTITGRTIEPHFFPLGRRDAHLFDFYVFPPYRGNQFNPELVARILARLAAQGCKRAFIEAAESNTAQLKSLRKMALYQLGVARKITVLGRTITVWS